MNMITDTIAALGASSETVGAIYAYHFGTGTNHHDGLPRELYVYLQSNCE